MIKWSMKKLGPAITLALISALWLSSYFFVIRSYIVRGGTPMSGNRVFGPADVTYVVVEGGGEEFKEESPQMNTDGRR